MMVNSAAFRSPAVYDAARAIPDHVKVHVTFWCYSPLLKREFRNEETHDRVADASLRALALNWRIERIVAA